MIEHCPMEVKSRGRLYTTERQRRQLGVADDFHGKTVSVGVIVVDREPSWGTRGEYATFQATFGSDGEITIPAEVRSILSLSYDDTVRVTFGVQNN